MRKSIIALAVLSTLAGSAYAEAGSVTSATVPVSVSADASGGTTPGQSSPSGVSVIAELEASAAEAACGCYSPPSGCS
jgi:hypothetical protein